MGFQLSSAEMQTASNALFSEAGQWMGSSKSGHVNGFVRPGCFGGTRRLDDGDSWGHIPFRRPP